MTTDLEALVVAAHVFADEYAVSARPGRRAQVSDSALVALAVCQAAMGISSDLGRTVDLCRVASGRGDERKSQLSGRSRL